MSEPRRGAPLCSASAHPHPCPPAMLMRMLEQIDLLHGLSSAELASMGIGMEPLVWSTGEVLFREGEPAEHVYMLAAGRAKCFRSMPSGQRTRLDDFGPGDVLGGLTWAGRNGYTETAVALVTSCALRIDAAAFRQVMLAYPSVALGVVDIVSNRLARARAMEQEQA